jgi:hypothetical protein
LVTQIPQISQIFRAKNGSGVCVFAAQEII